MKRGVTVLRRLEEERLGQLSAVSRLFLGIMMTNRPKMISLTERLREPVDLCNVARDSEVRMSFVPWSSRLTNALYKYIDITHFRLWASTQQIPRGTWECRCCRTFMPRTW